MSLFNDVGDFHRKFGLPTSGPIRGTTSLNRIPSIVDDRTFLFRYQFLEEELHELLKAHRARDLAGVADALADLVYVALGTAHFYGIPFDAVWAEVQRANMAKERSTGEDDGRSKRASAFDVVKPEGWTPPDIEGILRRVA